MGFVVNFSRFPAVQKFWKSVKIRQSYRQLKGGSFLRHSVVFRWTMEFQIFDFRQIIRHSNINVIDECKLFFNFMLLSERLIKKKRFCE